jgi:predicted RNA-binding protein associated with RNAse of E/G family
MMLSFRAIQNPPSTFVDGFTHVIIRTHIEHVHDCHSLLHETPITNTRVEALNSRGVLIITKDNYRVTNFAFKHVPCKIF